MPRPSCGYREVGCVVPPLTWVGQSLSPSGRGQSTRAPSQHPGARAPAAGATPHWAGPGMWPPRTQSGCQLMPQTCRHVTPRTGAQGNPPPLVSSSLPLPGERQLLLSEFPQPPLPAHHRRTPTLGAWHRPCPSCQGRPLPGSLPTLTSSLRHEALA